MTLFKKIIGVLIGTMILGLGVAFFEVSSLGYDGLSCLVVAIQKLINTSYSLAYLLVNLLFLIISFCKIIILIHKFNVKKVPIIYRYF